MGGHSVSLSGLSSAKPTSLGHICVFCGSSVGANPKYLAEAKSLGRHMAGRGWGLIYGGTSIGLMGATADAALSGGAEVIGVLPKALQDREIAHRGLTKLHLVGSMHERKASMASLSDAFIALPGGYVSGPRGNTGSRQAGQPEASAGGKRLRGSFAMDWTAAG